MATADTREVTPESRQPWFDEHNPAKRPLWVVENENNQIIGWVSFQAFYGRPAYDHTAEISLYLSAECRGKGIGKTVLTQVIEKAPSFGIKILLGFIFAHNSPSLRLFHRFGFADWATLPEVAELDGKPVSLKILGKKLAD